ncbi:MAG: pseudouridylate synthase, partial [Planctomycetes bacterium]|nr:pseudouridylate synthase [Planctomycetota bacterium]
YARRVPEPNELPILYRDDHIVAVSKPSGMLVHRSEKAPDRKVVLQTLAAQLGQYVYPVQRLDRGTSGVLVFGLSSRDAGLLQAALASERATKTYAALARWPTDAAPEPRFECRRPLRNTQGEPRPAHTEFEAIEFFERCALLRCRLYTGRFHQIRRHLNHCARHVIGDTTHGKGRINAEFRERFGLHRLFLHAARLRFEHPVLDLPIDLMDPLPRDLLDVLARLRTAQGAAGAEPRSAGAE